MPCDLRHVDRCSRSQTPCEITPKIPNSYGLGPGLEEVRGDGSVGEYSSIKVSEEFVNFSGRNRTDILLLVFFLVGFVSSAQVIPASPHTRSYSTRTNPLGLFLPRVVHASSSAAQTRTLAGFS